MNRFRLVQDRDKGRSKGYCFVEYVTLESAIQGVQRFNTLQIGNRTLRADFTNEFSSNEFGGGGGGQGQGGGMRGGNQGQGGMKKNQGAGMGVGGGMGNRGQGGGGMGSSGFGNKQQGGGGYNGQNMNMNQGQNQAYNNYNGGGFNNQNQQQNQHQTQNQNQNQAQDPTKLQVPNEISQTLSQLAPPDLLQFLSSSTELLRQNPVQMMEVFRSNPVLTYAVLQALLLMGLVDNTVVAKVVNAAAAGAPYNFLEDLPNIQQQQQIQQQQLLEQQQQEQQMGMGGNSRSSSDSPMPPPPPPPDMSQQQQPVDPNQAALISQVLQLSEEQISMLPPDQQAVIRQLKASYQG